MVIQYFVLFREVVSVTAQSVAHVVTSLAHVLFATVNALEAVDDTGRETVEGRVYGVDRVVGMRHDGRVSGETRADKAALVGAGVVLERGKSCLRERRRNGGREDCMSGWSTVELVSMDLRFL